MSAGTVEIPPVLSDAVAANIGEGVLPRWILEALGLAAFGDNMASTGEAAGLLGLVYFETLALVEQRGMPLKIGDEKFAHD